VVVGTLSSMTQVDSDDPVYDDVVGGGKCDPNKCLEGAGILLL
jgi:hypothetical protein